MSASHWFLKEEHTKFRNNMASIIEQASKDVCRPDARFSLGDEHDQCQFLFTKIYTLMRERENELTQSLLCCSKVADPVVELRYYRSRTRRSKDKSDPQFIESETGADFALALNVDFPRLLQAQRSVLGQAKILTNTALPIDDSQLERLLSVGGPESASYLIWGEGQPPYVVSGENIAAYTRTRGDARLSADVLALGKPLSEFFCDAFVGLWFGKDYDSKKEGESPPKNSIPILYHFLHRGVPPPNVIYFGMMSGQAFRIQPGVYVNDLVEI